MFGMRTGSRPVLRWAAPLAVIMAVAASGLVASTATAEPKLPPTTPEQLLVDLQSVSVKSLSGTVEQEANLGIPAIPGPSDSDSSEFNSLLTGKNRLGVWLSDPDKARIALYGDLGESDVITNGTDLWTWSSQQNKATHATVPEDTGPQTPGPTPSDLPKTPQEAAQQVLEAVGPTTDVSVDSAVTVAGRPAYDLVLRPRDQGSLLSEVRLAVDGDTHLPLKVEVFAGDISVFRVSYTEIDFTEPDAKLFTFTPPPGAEVTEVSPKADESKPPAPDRADEPKVVGEGWTTVVITDRSAEDSSGSSPGADDQLQAFLQQLPKVSGSWGSGRLLAGTAFTAVFTDDGQLAIGSVAPDVVYAALEK
jgi:outer membrane lipoprotein-sorting protein